MSFVGVVAGAGLQYLFTRVLEERRHHRDLRTQAFADYVRCVSEMRHAFIQPQAPREREMLSRLTDAKARICLYGSGQVVLKLAEFERLGGRVSSDTQQDAFVDVLIAMRGDGHARHHDLEAIMLGIKQ
jgi:hypothetical protein